VLVVAEHAPEAQQPQKVHRILFFNRYRSATGLTRVEEFRRALRELGYIEGQSIVFEYRYAGREIERFAELGAEMVRLTREII
jgi:putative ABC transport system substrate-binding protein